MSFQMSFTFFISREEKSEQLIHSRHSVEKHSIFHAQINNTNKIPTIPVHHPLPAPAAIVRIHHRCLQ